MRSEPIKGASEVELHSGIHVTIYAQIKMFNFTTIARNRKLRQSQRLNKFIKDLSGSVYFETKKGKGFYANSFPPAIQNAINTAVEGTLGTLGADKQQKWKVRSRKNVFLTSLFGMKEKFNLFTVYQIKSICLQSASFPCTTTCLLRTWNKFTAFALAERRLIAHRSLFFAAFRLLIRFVLFIYEAFALTPRI